MLLTHGPQAITLWPIFRAKTDKLTMPSPPPIPSKRATHLWVSSLIAILAIIWYTILFFSLSKNAGIASPLASSQYLISFVFLLIMTLIILITNRGNLAREKTLGEEQQQYFDLVKQAADPVVVLNELGIIVSANSAVEQVSGYKPEELVNRHFLKINILTGASIATAAREFLETLKGAVRKPFELSIIRRGGTPLITEAHARRVRDPNGRLAVHVILRDITSRKNTERDLLQEKNKAQNYLNIAGVIIMTLDRSGTVTMINKKGCSILGYPEDAIIGENWFEKFIPSEEKRDIKFVFDLLTSSEENLPQSNEYHVINKEGAKRLISWSNSLIRDNENNVVGTLSSGQDITEKRLIEDQLNLQGTALEAAANAIVITDKSGKIVWCNHAFTEMSGYSNEEIIGQNPRILKSGLHNEQFYENLWITINDGKIWNGEIVNCRKDGRLYTEEMTITPVKNRTGQIEHFIAIKRDVTERKRLQQNLEQANLALEANGRKLERTLLEMAAKNKQLQEAQNQLIQSEKLAAIGVLSSGIAHEIKNPLAIISLSIEEFEDHSEQLNDENKRYVQMIKNAADRANNVIIELLRFARTSDLRVENINCFGLIEGTFLLVKNSAKFKAVPITQTTIDKSLEISGDRILLEQVFFNLLINAIDSIEHDGTITVDTKLQKSSSTSATEDEIVIEVTDTGSGIPEEILPKIFEPFFTTKEQGKGTGLGLSTVYTLLKRHRGTIDVRSTVGKGSTFIVTLPLAKKEQAEE
jgi:PAS domain S-box-containing protein